MISREIFERIGLFDADMRACEDYDLWLRITAERTVDFIDEPLVIKHGGHDDQLSRTVKALDRYRIYSLLKLLVHTQLTSDKRAAVKTAIREKSQILANGARKRDNVAMANSYEQLLNDLDWIGEHEPPSATQLTVGKQNRGEPIMSDIVTTDQILSTFCPGDHA